MVTNSFTQFQQVPEALLYPWEIGPTAAVFNVDADPLPQCPGLAETFHDTSAQPSDTFQGQLTRFLIPDGAKYMHAVKRRVYKI